MWNLSWVTKLNPSLAHHFQHLPFELQLYSFFVGSDSSKLFWAGCGNGVSTLGNICAGCTGSTVAAGFSSIGIVLIGSWIKGILAMSSWWSSWVLVYVFWVPKGVTEGLVVGSVFLTSKVFFSSMKLWVVELSKWLLLFCWSILLKLTLWVWGFYTWTGRGTFSFLSTFTGFPTISSIISLIISFSRIESTSSWVVFLFFIQFNESTLFGLLFLTSTKWIPGLSF